MARIFITGSADGLGFLAAKALVSQGHKVTLHARNHHREEETLKKLPSAEAVITGELSDLEEVAKLAQTANERGAFDAVIHNAGVYRANPKVILTVNTLAPYVLTCLMQRPKRLIYLSSGLHLQGRPNLEKFEDGVSYSDSKLHDLVLAKAVARKWTSVYSNAVNPGWVPTKMGGAGAPDDLTKGYETQTWLATSDDDAAKVSGKYFFHKRERSYNTLADDIELQEKFLRVCEEITGFEFPQ